MTDKASWPERLAAWVLAALIVGLVLWVSWYESKS